MSSAIDAVISIPHGLPVGVEPKDVLDAACRLGGIRMAILLAPSRKIGIKISKISKIQRPWFRRTFRIQLRAACAWIMRERLDMSLTEIGAHLGYSDHTTVLHHLRHSCTTTRTRDVAAAIESEIRRAATEKEPKAQ
jgi:hypothetical protein